MAVNPLGISAGVASVIATYATGFSSGDVVDMGAANNRGYEVLDSGILHAVVVKPPVSFNRGRQGVEGFGTYDTLWTLTVEVFQRVVSAEGQTLRLLSQDVGYIVDALDQYNRLDGVSGVYDSKPYGGEGYYEVFDRDGNGPFFQMAELTIGVIEDVDVTFKG